MGEAPEINAYVPSELMNQLASAEGEYIQVRRKNGPTIIGKLNYVGPDRTHPGKGFIIVDYGMSISINEDDIVNFSINTK